MRTMMFIPLSFLGTKINWFWDYQVLIHKICHIIWVLHACEFYTKLYNENSESPIYLYIFSIKILKIINALLNRSHEY